MSAADDLAGAPLPPSLPPSLPSQAGGDGGRGGLGTGARAAILSFSVILAVTVTVCGIICFRHSAFGRQKQERRRRKRLSKNLRKATDANTLREALRLATTTMSTPDSLSPSLREEWERMLALERKRLEAHDGIACEFWFVKAHVIRDGLHDAEEYLSLPTLQTLQEHHPDWLSKMEISRVQAFTHQYRNSFCTVSHRWLAATEPDAEGTQLKAVRAFLQSPAGLNMEYMYAHTHARRERESSHDRPG